MNQIIPPRQLRLLSALLSGNSGWRPAVLSGTMPIDPATGALAEPQIAAQAEQVMKNIGAVLQAAGCTFEDVVKTTCFLADMADFAAFNEIYARYFTGKPARSCVAVKSLPKGALVEVEVIASH